MEKVIFIAYYFPPIGGAGVQRSQKFVQYLPAEGYLPVVVTGPRVPDDRWTPKDASLLQQIPREIPVYRTEEPVPGPGSKLHRRLESWLGFRSDFSRWWTESATRVACRVGKDASLIFATMSPFESAEVAGQVARQLGIPWVADLRDPWALDEMMIYPSALHRKIAIQRMERLLSSAGLIVMNTPEAVAAIRANLPLLGNKKIISVTNGFDREDFAGVVKQRSDKKFRIVHSGYLHTEAGLQLRQRRYASLLGGVEKGVDILTRSHSVLLQALERWSAKRPEVRDDLELVLAGKTSTGDQAVVSKSPLAVQTRFTGYLSHAKSLELVRTADLLFLPMHNLPEGKRSRIVPGKTYEYIASERPILAAVPDGDARDFLAQTGTSLLCRPDDLATMAELIDLAYTSWKQGKCITRHNKAFCAAFERRSLTSTLARAFDTVLAERTSLAPVSVPSKQNAHATV